MKHGSNRGHPYDVVALFPPFLLALSQVFQYLVESGLEVYLQEEQWYWQWTRLGVHSSDSYGSMGEALIAALDYRLWPGYDASKQARN